jgi:hypothetical protein
VVLTDYELAPKVAVDAIAAVALCTQALDMELVAVAVVDNNMASKAVVLQWQPHWMLDVIHPVENAVDDSIVAYFADNSYNAVRFVQLKLYF